MQSWRPRLEFFWADHRGRIGGLLLCAALLTALFAAAALKLWLDYAPTPPIAVSTEGTVIGFIGGDSKYSTGLLVYFQTSKDTYGYASLPFASECHDGDRIFLTQWRVNGRLHYRWRPPGCARKLATGLGRHSL